MSNSTPRYSQSLEATTVNTLDGLDATAFYTTPDGLPTMVTGGALEQIIPESDKDHLKEVDRYWAVYPYSFISIFKSTRNNEYYYYVVEPSLSDLEQALIELLAEKLRASFRYLGQDILSDSDRKRRAVIREQLFQLLDMYGLYEDGAATKAHAQSDLSDLLNEPPTGAEDSSYLRNLSLFGSDSTAEEDNFEYTGPDATTYGGRLDTEYLDINTVLEGHPAFHESTTDTDDSNTDSEATSSGLTATRMTRFQFTEETDTTTLNDYHVYKILYVLERQFVGYKKIDAIKNDINVEDITCNGYNEPVFVYHSSYGQTLTNVQHGESDLDSFVTSLAQFAGTEISRRSPTADATLPDGSHANLTLGTEISDKGTNYTIRQFNDVPFTPVDLINWNTYSLEQLALLWLAVEHKRSILVVGETASGKTTTLNALSLFIPPTDKIVSIEDTRELTLPQQNWTASVTQQGAQDDFDTEKIDEVDLLEGSFRQRPDYILVDEVQGEEGKTLFRIMSAGYTTYSTFRANTVDDVVKRFTTDPVDIDRTKFIALDFIAVQQEMYVNDTKQRRAKNIAEVRHYDPDNDELTVADIYKHDEQTDTYNAKTTPDALMEIANRMGWSRHEIEQELYRRQVVLAYLVANGINTYDNVATMVQAYMVDKESVLEHISNGTLESALDDLKDLRYVDIKSDPATEASVPRPSPDRKTREGAAQLLEDAPDDLITMFEVPSPSDDEVGSSAISEADIGGAEDMAKESPTHTTAESTADSTPSASASETAGPSEATTTPSAGPDSQATTPTSPNRRQKSSPSATDEESSTDNERRNNRVGEDPTPRVDDVLSAFNAGDYDDDGNADEDRTTIPEVESGTDSRKADTSADNNDTDTDDDGSSRLDVDDDPFTDSSSTSQND